MTIRAVGRYLFGAALLVGGVGFASVVAHPDINAALTLVGLGAAYTGLGLLRIRPGDRRPPTSPLTGTAGNEPQVTLRDAD